MEHLAVRAASLAAPVQVNMKITGPPPQNMARQSRKHGGLGRGLSRAGCAFRIFTTAARYTPQWNLFTEALMTDFAEKLVSAERIGFTELIEVFQAVGNI